MVGPLKTICKCYSFIISATVILYMISVSKILKNILQVWCTICFWALWSSEMCTGPLFQIKLHSRSTVSHSINHRNMQVSFEIYMAIFSVRSYFFCIKSILNKTGVLWFEMYKSVSQSQWTMFTMKLQTSLKVVMFDWCLIWCKWAIEVYWNVASGSRTWWLLLAWHWVLVIELTHLPLDKMAAISQTIFSKAFSWMKSFVFWFKFHWSLFLRVPLTIIQHWFR